METLALSRTISRGRFSFGPRLHFGADRMRWRSEAIRYPDRYSVRDCSGACASTWFKVCRAGKHICRTPATAAIALVCLFLVPKQFTDKKQANSGISDSFTVGPYRLGDVIEDFTQLVEFSPAEYAQIEPKFKGEKDYNAPAVNFLGIMWAVQLRTVHGKIYKIAPYLLRATKYEANPIATNILRFCKDQLGVPAEQKTGWFVWDTSDGNVIFQTGEVNEGFSLALFLTSNW